MWFKFIVIYLFQGGLIYFRYLVIQCKSRNMNLNLSTALDLDTLPESYLVTISEEGNADGSFVVGTMLEKSVRQKQSIILVLFHNTFGHYHGIASKLGYNLAVHKAKGSLVVVDAMEEFFGKEGKGSAEKEVENALRRIFTKTKTFVEERRLAGESVTIVLEHPANALIAGGSSSSVLVSVQYFRSLCGDGVSLVCLGRSSHLPPLDAYLQHHAHLSVLVSGLKTGSAADISGSLLTTRRELIADPNRQSHFHYQLLDKRVRVFAPGFVQLR